MKAQKTVFMIDDDIEDQEIFSEALCAMDPTIKCIKLFNAKQALRILSTAVTFPELIFVDLNMPEMNGYEFLTEIKKDTNLTHIPVIVYTTSSDRKHKDEALRLGASSFITKPTNINELLEKLQAIFSLDHHN